MLMAKLIFRSLIILLLAVPVYSEGQVLPEKNFLRGKALFEQEKYDSALIALTISKGLNEKDPETWYYSGLTYFHMGRIEDAIHDFSEAEKLQTGIAALMLSKAYARQDNIEKSLKFLDIHLKSRDKKPESMILLDEDFSRFENRKEWITFWRNSNHYSAFDRTLAEASYLAKSEEYLEAIETLSEALDRGFRSAPLLAKRAEVYMQMGNEELAIKDLNDATGSDRRNEELFILRGDLNYRQENFRRAVEDYDRALRLNPGNFSVYPRRALAYSKSGMYEEAKEDMMFYLEYFSEDDHAWYTMGIINMESGKYLDALRNLNRALEMEKSHPEYYLARGKSYYHARTFKYANNDLSMALDLDPKNAEAYYMKGLTAVELGDNEMACFCFERAYKYGKREAFNYIGSYCK